MSTVIQLLDKRGFRNNHLPVRQEACKIPSLEGVLMYGVTVHYRCNYGHQAYKPVGLRLPPVPQLLHLLFSRDHTHALKGDAGGAGI